VRRDDQCNAAEALGERLSLDSPHGAGTTLHASCRSTLDRAVGAWPSGGGLRAAPQRSLGPTNEW